MNNSLKNENYKVLLSQILQPGFDYYGFAQAVQKDPAFTPEQKQHIITKFNPSQAVQIRPRKEKNTLNEFRWATPPSHFAIKRLPHDHPTTQAWQQVWQEALTHYAPQVAAYDAKMQKKTPAQETGRISTTAEYPHIVPPIFAVETKGLNASVCMDRDTFRDTLKVNTDIMNLPIAQQKAVLAHEAQHLLEPMLHGMEPMAFSYVRAVKNRVTQNASSRKEELKADGLAGALGMGQDMATALDVMQHETSAEAQADKALAGHLKDAGFKIDQRAFTDHAVSANRNAGLLSDPANTAATRAGKLAKDFNQTLTDDGAFTRAIRIVKSKMSPSKASHPKPDVRIQRLTAPPSTAVSSKPTPARKR